MKGFIEVTNADDKSKVLVSVNYIKFIEEREYGTFIVINLFFEKKTVINSGYSVAESFSEVVEKIKQANDCKSFSAER